MTTASSGQQYCLQYGRAMAMIMGLMLWVSTALAQTDPKPKPQKKHPLPHKNPVTLRSAPPKQQASPYNGWDYLVEQLRHSGVPYDDIRRVYADRRMPAFSFIPFSVAPRESHESYRPHHSPVHIQLGKEFITRHQSSLAMAEARFGVTRYVIAAILLVETRYGRVLGNHLIIHRLSRVASVQEPSNLTFNYKRLKRIDSKVTWESVAQRAAHLEKTFLPEIVALLEIFRRDEMQPFDLRGSHAGAFGIPQFLPSSFLRFAFDGNEDGRISLFDPEDAIWSTAHFLHNFGWKDDAPREAQAAVIWRYNHSDAYVDTVLTLTEALAGV